MTPHRLQLLFTLAAAACGAGTGYPGDAVAHAEAQCRKHQAEERTCHDPCILARLNATTTKPKMECVKAAEFWTGEYGAERARYIECVGSCATAMTCGPNAGSLAKDIRYRDCACEAQCAAMQSPAFQGAYAWLRDCDTGLAECQR